MRISHVKLPAPLPAQSRLLRGRAGSVALYEAGHGAPILMLHSVNAAASAFEMRPAFEAMLATHRVFAVDLPGFGLSDRSDRRYDVPLYVAAIEDALQAIEVECGTVPVHVLALSLSCEFAARVAVRHPQRIASLGLISATGLDRRSQGLRSAPGMVREVPGMHTVIAGRPWSQPLFNLLVSGPSMRFFLRKTWGAQQIDEALFDYSFASAHQPGARFAPLAFVSGRLFSADIRTVYESLSGPVWLAHGVRGDFQDFSAADQMLVRPNWSREIFQTGALLHFEQPQAFATSYRHFLARAGGPS
jgi:pimeloyl-ACP methyl ester carboxylesterase